LLGSFCLPICLTPIGLWYTNNFLMSSFFMICFVSCQDMPKWNIPEEN
jgi:hypothetical protein